MEKRLNRQTVFEGKIITLHLDQVKMPSGRQSTREVVSHRPAVAILAQNELGEVLCVRQWRYAIGKEVLEIPAGLIDSGETPLEAAHRELREETGFDADLTLLTTLYTSPGFCDEVIHLYEAHHLVSSPLQPDEDEDLTLQWVPFERLIGDCADGKTLAALAFARR